MKNKDGLWIDHRQAVIVTMTNEGEEIKRIASDIEKHVRFSSGADEDGSTEDVRDRQYGNHLTAFYHEVIENLHQAESIYIFGPGEAKGELAKHIENDGLKRRTFEVETEDKMTDNQIVAKVRQYFEK